MVESLTSLISRKTLFQFEEYLAAQGRFKHLFKDEYKYLIKEWQERVDAQWAYLQRREESRV